MLRALPSEKKKKKKNFDVSVCELLALSLRETESVQRQCFQVFATAMYLDNQANCHIESSFACVYSLSFSVFSGRIRSCAKSDDNFSSFFSLPLSLLNHLPLFDTQSPKRNNN